MNYKKERSIRKRITIKGIKKKIMIKEALRDCSTAEKTEEERRMEKVTYNGSDEAVIMK